MQHRALVDWADDEDFAERRVDDWTAGDDFDFAVAARRRRITGDRSAHLTPVEDVAESAAAEVVERPREEPRPRHVPGQRRTVAITGRPDVLREVPRLREVERRRTTRGPAERVAARPDRSAMWAVALGFVLILIAATSSRADAATFAHAKAHHAAPIVRVR